MAQEAVARHVGGTFMAMTLLFYDALTRIALYPTSCRSAATGRAAYRLAARRNQMPTSSEQSPENYQQMYLLTSAELARIERP